MSVKKQNVEFSKFDLSHVHKTTMDMGQLVPIACIPTLPGDKLNVDVSSFVRGMPTLAPIMDKVDIKINHFYVPYRILWNKFEEFISHSEKYKLRGTPAPAIPQMDTKKMAKAFKEKLLNLEVKGVKKSGTVKKDALGIEDYLDIPENNAVFKDTLETAFGKKVMSFLKKYPIGKLAHYLGFDEKNGLVSMMPILAYNKIFMDYYVPQRWVNYLISGNKGHRLAYLAGELDYYKNVNNTVYEGIPNNALISTSANGWDDVNAFLPFIGLSSYKRTNSQSDISSWIDLFTLKNVYWNHDYFSNALPEPTIFGDVALPLFNENVPENQKHLIASGGARVEFASSGNYANATDIAHNKSVMATIRDLRKAISLQHYYETLSQGGGRYLETMEVMWNKRLPDDMLQRSEYLGGSVVPLFVNEVEQTAPAMLGDKQTYLGDLSGKPVAAGDFENINFEADEYGVYMCLAHVVPKRSYYTAFNRAWKETDVMDFPNPAFEGVGDQAVYNYEINGGDDNSVFGYVPSYSHYKTALDRFSGEMVHGLKHWHLGDFSAPILGQNISPEWFECVPREDIFVMPAEPDKLISTFRFNISAVRPLAFDPPAGVGRV